MSKYDYNDYDDYDEYDEYYDDEYKSKRKPRREKEKNPYKGKGHQTKYGRGSKNTLYEEMAVMPYLDPVYTPTPKTTQVEEQSKPQVVTPPSPPQHIEGAHTKEIKGYKIDFDRLADIQSIEQEYNGQTTYGIKFLFAGKKGLFRIVWYNRHKKLRDVDMDDFVKYWNSVK